jgi:lysophospholipase L1-like esterase
MLLGGSLNRIRIAIAASAVLAVTLSGWAWEATRPPTECETETLLNNAAPDWWGNAGPTVTVIGDSWSVGGALPAHTDGFPYLLADQMGWRVRIAGGSGTGFQQPGGCDTNYVDRAATIPKDTRLVLFEGGINDAARGPSLRGLPEAIHAAVTAAEKRAPQAQVVILGIPTLPYFSAAEMQRINSVLQESAAAAGAIWLPARDRVDLYWDDVHPTPKGHRQYAEHIVRALRVTMPEGLAQSPT